MFLSPMSRMYSPHPSMPRLMKRDSHSRRFGSESQAKPSTALAIPEAVKIVPNPRLSPKDVLELFPQGLKDLVFQQGTLENCYFLASVDALSRNPYGRRRLMQLIRPLGGGIYDVYFPGKPGSVYRVTLADLAMPCFRQASLRNGEPLALIRLKPSQGARGVQILEHAFGQMLLDLKGDRSHPWIAYPDGASALAMLALTGHPPGLEISTRVAKNRAWEDSNSFLAESLTKPELLDAVAYELNQLSRHPARNLVTVGTPAEELAAFNAQDGTPYVDKVLRFLAGHEFSVRHIDAQRRTLTLVDPHDTGPTLTLSYAEFFRYFNYLQATPVPEVLSGEEELPIPASDARYDPLRSSLMAAIRLAMQSE